MRAVASAPDTTPVWREVSLPRFPKLSQDLRIDVAVIGAGITGITTAYLLKQAGHKVALFERQRLAAMDTGHTSAHLTCVTDTRLTQLVHWYGEQHGAAAWDAGLAAIDQIHRNIQEEAIACDFRWVPVYLHTPLREPEVRSSDRKRLLEEAELADRLGFSARFHEAVPYVGLPGMELANQALFHPRKYLRALAKRIPGRGSHVFEFSGAGAIEDAPLSVQVNGHKVSCGYVVVATNNPIVGTTSLLKATLFQTKLALYTSYVLGARIPSGLLPQASYWDSDNPYYYLRIDPGRGHDYAIFGGEDHKTGQEKNTRKPYRDLAERLRKLIPEARIERRWSGQILETHDGLPYIGEVADQQFIATGYCGNGMTFATIAALMCRDQLAGKKNPWTRLFDPSRKQLSGVWDYLKENADYPYYLLRDRIVRGSEATPGEVRRGEGKIVKTPEGKRAAYRDDQGVLTLLSPVCTHLGCLVRWNQAERTWDCPCHGSRFAPTGAVLSGPAEKPLAREDHS